MNKNQRKKYYETLFLHAIYLAVFLLAGILRTTDGINAVTTFHIGALTVSIVMNMIIYGGLVRNSATSDERSNHFLLYIRLSSFSCFLCLLNWVGNGTTYLLNLRRIVTVAYYIVQFITIFVFAQIIQSMIKKENNISNSYSLLKEIPMLKLTNWTYIFLFALLIAAIFTDNVFSIDASGVYHKRMFDFLPSLSMCIVCYTIIVACRKKEFSRVLRMTIATYIIINTVSFVWQIVSPYYEPSAALNCSTILMVYCTNYVEMEIYNNALNEKFERYVSEDEAKKLLQQGGDALTLGGNKTDISVMMSQLRDFELIGKLLDADDVGKLLNHYYQEMTTIIEKHRGTVLSFPGYGIMAVFGAPIMFDGFTTEAVDAAIEMQNKMKEVNEWNHENHLPKIHMGIGIANGDTILGNIGSEKHMRYSAISRIVNLCSRIESYAQPDKILITDKTRLLYNGNLQTGQEDEVYMKGFTDSIMFYEIETGENHE